MSIVLVLFFTIDANAQFGKIKSQLKGASLKTKTTTTKEKTSTETEQESSDETVAGDTWYVSKTTGKNKNDG